MMVILYDVLVAKRKDCLLLRLLLRTLAERMYRYKTMGKHASVQ